MARNVSKIIFDDGTVQIINPAAADPTPAPVPPAGPPAAGLIRGGYFDFVPDDQARKYADEFGMTWARLWHTVKWDETLGTSHPTFERCRRLQAAGLKTLVVFTPPEKTGAPPADPSLASKYFQSAVNAANGAVNAWEIFNEPNLSNYNTSYASQSTLWIRNALMPAYTALKQRGQFVVSGGWSEGLGGMPWMITNGLLSACDAVGYHPYGGGAGEQIDRVTQMRKLIGNKPLWLTEWNLHMDASQPQSWGNSLIVAASNLRSMVEAVFHFRMVRTSSAAGVAAPYAIDSGVALSPAAVFHDATAAAMKSLA